MEPTEDWMQFYWSTLLHAGCTNIFAGKPLIQAGLTVPEKLLISVQRSLYKIDGVSVQKCISQDTVKRTTAKK